MASIADLISNLKKKLKGGYNTVADALPIVPNTSQIKSFASNPVQFMVNPSYNGGNNLYRTTPFKIGAQVQNNIYKNAQSPDPLKSNFAKMYVGAGEAVRDYFDPRKTPTLLSKQGITNYGKAVGLTALPILNMAMIPKVSPQTFLGSAGIGAGFNALLGNQNDSLAKRMRYGAVSGIQSAPLTKLVTGFTNPLTDKMVSKIPLKNLAPKAKVIIEGVARGAAAIPEGMAINAAQRQPYTPLDLALDVSTGSGLSSYAGDKMGKAGSKAINSFLDWYKKNSMTGSQKSFARQGMIGNVRSMHPEDLFIFDQANEVVQNPKKYSQQDVMKANDFMFRFAEKYLPNKMQPDNANAKQIANRLQKRMGSGTLQTFEGGFAKLDEPIVGTGKKATSTFNTSFNEYYKFRGGYKAITNGSSDLTGDYVKEVIKTLESGGKVSDQSLGDAIEIANTHLLNPEQALRALSKYDMKAKSYLLNKLTNTFPEINSFEGSFALSKKISRIKEGLEITDLNPTRTGANLVRVSHDGVSAEGYGLNGAIDNLQSALINKKNGVVPKTAQQIADIERQRTVGGQGEIQKIKIGESSSPTTPPGRIQNPLIEEALSPEAKSFMDIGSGNYKVPKSEIKKTNNGISVLYKGRGKVDFYIQKDGKIGMSYENLGDSAPDFVIDAWSKSKSQLTDIWNQANKGVDINKAIDIERSIRNNVSKVQQDYLDGKITIEQRKALADKEFARSIANKGVGATQDIPKTVKVWIKSKFSNDGAFTDVPVVRKEDNITLYQGGNGENRQFWTPNKKYAEQFGDVTEKTGTFYKVDNGNRVTDVYVEAPSNTSPKFSPTEMTREEKVLRDQLKRGDITPQQYNEIAIKNEGKIKPIQQDPNKLYQQAKMIEDMAKNDRNMARAEAQAVQDTTLDLTVKDRQKLSQLGKIIRKADEKGMWDVETLRKDNKGLVNWATERWRELNYGTKDNLTDDELIQEIADFTERSLAQKVKVATPDTVKIRQGLLDERSNTVPNVENQFPVRNGKPVDAAFAERQAKLQEQAYEQTYGARNATNNELEALMNTPDNELKGGYKIEKKTDKPMIQLKGKNDEPKTFREIVNRFLGGKQNIKLTQYEQVKPISNVKFSEDGAKQAIKAIESGNTFGLPSEAQSYVSKLRKSFDEVRKEAVNDGLDIGYVENYLTHYWEQPMAQVQEVVNRLRKSGAFQKSRTFLTYQEGIDAGLTPRFSNPTQILGNYVRQVENVRNNLKFIKALEANGYVVSGKERELTQGVRQIAVPGFEGRFAKPEVANLIEGLFEPKKANVILSKLGKISGKIQDITLSGGIPKTPFNAFSIAGNLQKQFLAGRFSGPLKSFARAFSPESTDRYFVDKMPIIREIQGAGYSLPTTLSYKNLMGEGKDGVMAKAGGVWDSAMSDPTFKRFIPMMQIDLYKEVKNAALKSGLDEKQAVEKALQVLKNFEGMSDQFSQATADPNARAVTQTFLFAPKFRRAMVDFWINSIKALKNPLAIENRYNTRFMAGAAITFAGMNLANAYFNNGKMMWENGKGKEDKLMIPDGKGGAIGVPFLSSIGTIPRGMYRQGISLVKGDIAGAVKDAGQTYLSSGIKPLADVAANEDYFGKTIVQPDSNNKWLDVVKYLGKSYISHPYLKELVDPANTSDPAYQRLSRAMELPFRFYDKKSIDGSRYYEARDKAISALSENEKKALGAIPKYDANNPDTQIYKYQTFLTYPNVFEAKRATEFELAKQTGKAIDPLYLVNYDTAKAYMRYETLPPGSQDRKDLIKAKPELGALFDVRSRFFDENPIEGESVTVSKRPLPSAYVQAQMNAKNWADPEVKAYLDANKQYQNDQRSKLGLTPLAGFTPYEKKIKVAAMKKIKAPKIKLAKVKNVKIKIPKLKLAKAKAIKLKSLKTKSLVKLRA